MTIATWSVGVTTSRRPKPTIERTLRSLAAAGWNEPRLFVEADGVVPSDFRHLPVSQRDLPLGAFPNWYLGLAELVMREPHAEAYLVCQDDVVLCRGLRIFLERVLWPTERVGIVSLYCASHVAVGKAAGFHADDRGWDSWGALAYVFPNISARSFLGHPLVLQHRARGPNAGLRNIDSVVGAWCRWSALPYFVHVPSLVEHIGDTSAIYSGGDASGKRRSRDFVGEETDISSW